MAEGTHRIILPESRRRYRFAITPLADAMFLLLVFFMLSSNLSVYALLPLTSAPAQSAESATPSVPGEDGAATAAAPQPRFGETRIWRVEAEAVIVGGQRFAFDRLDLLTEALTASDAEASVALIVHPTARVQDVVTVLARLEAAGMAHVKIYREK